MSSILRLLFTCCHPELPATQQIALALRVVSGLSVRQIARAFLVGERAMGPSPVVTLNRAVAVSKIHGPEAALHMLEGLAEVLSGYFYFHGLRGALLKQLRRHSEAQEALSRAVALAGTAAEAAHIREHLDELEAAGAGFARK